MQSLDLASFRKIYTENNFSENFITNGIPKSAKTNLDSKSTPSTYRENNNNFLDAKKTYDFSPIKKDPKFSHQGYLAEILTPS